MNLLNKLFILFIVSIEIVCFDYDEEIDNRILDGKKVDIKEFPHEAIILEENYLFYDWISYTIMKCGGSILDSRHILTAAHCIVMDAKQQVVLGEGNSNWFHKHDPDNTYNVEKKIVHEKYEPILQNTTDEVFYDIAILRLYSEIIFRETVDPVKMYLNKAIAENDTYWDGYRFKWIRDFIVIGHGESYDWWYKYFGYRYFRMAVMRMYKRWYENNGFFTNRHKRPMHPYDKLIYLRRRTNFTNAGTISYGDSGSSLLILKNQTYYMVGINSVIYFNDDGYISFATFTRVSYFFDWIYEKVGITYKIKRQ